MGLSFEKIERIPVLREIVITSIGTLNELVLYKKVVLNGFVLNSKAKCISKNGLIIYIGLQQKLFLKWNILFKKASPIMLFAIVILLPSIIPVDYIFDEISNSESYVNAKELICQANYQGRRKYPFFTIH